MIFIENNCAYKKLTQLFFILLFITSLTNAQTNNTLVSDSVLMPEVKVSATLINGSLKNVVGSISVITKKDIENHNSLTVAGQLNSLPGIYMHNGTNTTNRIVIRGIGSRTPYSSNRIRAYLNDIPLTNGDGVTTIEDIDVERLGRIEVIKGPSSALYGSGLGGTIKLTTNTTNESLKLSSTLSSFNTLKLGTTASGKLGDFQFNASYFNTKSDGYRQNNKYNKHSMLLTSNKRFNKTDVSFTLLYTDYNAQIPSSLNYQKNFLRMYYLTIVAKN